MHLGRMRRRSNRRNGQAGYILLTLMLMVTLLVIAALAVGPSITTQIKRDREEELVHRGAQYARAIKKFYKKFGRYPVSLEQLENTNNVKFLRKRYKDPITGKDFRLLHFGEVKLVGKVSGVSGGQTPVPDNSDGNKPDNQNQETGQPVDVSSIGKSSGTGTTFGGPVIGVSSISEKTSLKEFNEKNHYNEWQFLYDPTMDRGGLITGPYVPAKVGAGGLVPSATPGQNPGASGSSPFTGGPVSTPITTTNN